MGWIGKLKRLIRLFWPYFCLATYWAHYFRRRCTCSWASFVCGLCTECTWQKIHKERIISGNYSTNSLYIFWVHTGSSLLTPSFSAEHLTSNVPSEDNQAFCWGDYLCFNEWRCHREWLLNYRYVTPSQWDSTTTCRSQEWHWGDQDARGLNVVKCRVPHGCKNKINVKKGRHVGD